MGNAVKAALRHILTLEKLKPRLNRLAKRLSIKKRKVKRKHK